MATGRTPSKFFKFQIEDSTGALRDVPVMTINGVGITYEEQNMTALQDALTSVLIGQGAVNISISGPFDNTAAQAASASGAAAALSGSHTVLEPLNGGQTPRAFGIYIGIRTYWTTGDPCFGVNGATSTAGVTVSDYVVDINNMTYSAKLALYPGSVADWGTTDFTT